MAFGGAYKVDALTTFLDVLFIAIIAMSIVFGPDYLVPRGLPVAEFAAILVFAMTGAMLISASADLLLLFLGLELMVLPGYMLAAFHKTDAFSTEGAIKYFLLGSFSSAIFLFGLSFVWGLTGTTRIDAIADRPGQDRGRRGPAVARAGDGPGLPDHRRRVQDRRGAVPLLDPGRVPGLADADHGLPVGRPQGRRLRADPAPVRRSARPAGRLVDAGRHRAGHADHDPRQPRRAHAGQRQADARLQLDRPHRLHARRPGGVGRRPAEPLGRHHRAAVLRRRLRVHEPRGVRGHRRAPEADGGDVEPRHVRGARPARAAARRADDAVPAVAHRHPADGRASSPRPRSSWPRSKPAVR